MCSRLAWPKRLLSSHETCAIGPALRALRHRRGAPGEAHPRSPSVRTAAGQMYTETASETCSLWEGVTQVYQRAQDAGAAYKFQTRTEIVQSDGVQFILRIAESLRDKPKAPATGSGAKQEWKNPFLPYEESLWVRHLSDTHTLLLNKFNVVDHHLLVVTRKFEKQEEPLNFADLSATWQVLQAMPRGGLAFFNCGPESGASQPHKHVQVVPLPLSFDAPSDVPIAGAITSSGAGKDALEVFEVRSLPFVSYAGRIAPESDASSLAHLFSRLLSKLATAGRDASYNVVLTSQWMLMVARSANACGIVPVNALGCAGTLFVRSQEEIDSVKSIGPLGVLKAVGFPWD